MSILQVGPFVLDIELIGGGIQIQAGVAAHWVKFDETVYIDAEHPSVSIETPTVSGFSASLSISVDDASGRMSANAQVCYPIFSRQHCDHFGVTVPLLPANELGLLAAGVTSEGLPSPMSRGHGVSGSDLRELRGDRRRAGPRVGVL